MARMYQHRGKPVPAQVYSRRTPPLIEISSRFLDAASPNTQRYVAWHEVCHIKLGHRGYSHDDEYAAEVCVWKALGKRYRVIRKAWDHWNGIPARANK